MSEDLLTTSEPCPIFISNKPAANSLHRDLVGWFGFGWCFCVWLVLFGYFLRNVPGDLSKHFHIRFNGENIAVIFFNLFLFMCFF